MFTKEFEEAKKNEMSMAQFEDQTVFKYKKISMLILKKNPKL